MPNQVHDKLGVPVRYIVSNPSSYTYPSDERPTAAAWSLTANAPGYISEVRPGAPAFASLGTGRGCTNYNQGAFGLVNRRGSAANQRDEQSRRQLVARPTTSLLGELDILPLAGFDGSVRHSGWP